MSHPFEPANDGEYTVVHMFAGSGGCSSGFELDGARRQVGEVAVGIPSTARETPVQRREACIYSRDRKYVFVDGSNPQLPLYRLTCAGCPCIEGDDGIVQRFRNGAEIATLAVDYGATKRAILAAIRTMHRFWEGIRS